MTFTTTTFIVFLTIVFAAYWAIPGRRAQNALLVVASYVFYGWWDWRFCGLMFTSTVADFTFGILIDRSRPAARRAWLASAVSANLALLGYFKYFNFFAASVADAASSIGWTLDRPTLEVILPVGISFYTFQSIGYTIDVYRGHIPPVRSLIDYIAYVAFFPQLVAGPIERAGHLIPQFLTPRTFDAAAAADGCRLVLWGFFKKLAVADNAARYADVAYGAPEECGGLRLLFGTAMFAVQIYGDFSGYSDIARGTSKFFGFELMRNFEAPYFSTSLRDFWQRWHVSLSTWFRDYLYFPLGGSRHGLWLTVRNLLITFTVSGMWHGASWTFAVWGLLHGVALSLSVVWSANAGERRPSPLRSAAGWAATMAVVGAGWVFFRAETLADAVCVFRRIASDPFSGSGPSVSGVSALTTLALAAVLFGAEWLCRDVQHPLESNLPRAGRWIAYTCLFWAVVYFAPSDNHGFIYFQF